MGIMYQKYNGDKKAQVATLISNIVVKKHSHLREYREDIVR